MARDPAPRGRIDWIASYPKSGNTWMRLLLTNYFSGAEAPHDINERGITRGIAASRYLLEDALCVSCDDLLPGEIQALRPEAYAVLAETYPDLWLKAHDRQSVDGATWLFPAQASGVAIYLVRNPLDVAVSNAFHDGDSDMARAVDKLCDGGMAIGDRRGGQVAQHLGDWSSHVTSWVDHNPFPVLTIRYEDMLADAGAVLRRVIAFARPDAVIDQGKIARAVARSRIDALQAAEDRQRFREAPQRAARFFRRGVAGDWRNHLSRDQVARIRDCHGDMMRRFGYADGADQERN